MKSRQLRWSRKKDVEISRVKGHRERVRPAPSIQLH